MVAGPATRSLKRQIQSLFKLPSCVRCLSTAPLPSAPLPVKGGPLASLLRNSIKATGPLPLSRYMQFCLSHPLHGYYAQGDVFGQKGDFITSPEISQIFGELVAIWLLTRYMSAGSPKRCRIIELGPGRGTLMEDVLRTLTTFPAIREAIKGVVLVENSENMRAVQSEKLGKQCEQAGIALSWHDKVDDVEPSEDFTMFIAHEFFDAMPVNLFERTNDGFREVCVDIDPAYDPLLPSPSSSSGLRLAIARDSTTLASVLPATSVRFAELPVGSRVEIAPDSWQIMRRIGEVLGAEGAGGGAGLVVDYGGDQSFGSSFRAFKNHKIVDIFEEPGTADLTANVDFTYLKESLADSGTHTLGPIPQSAFLLRLGLQARLQKLLDSAPTPERKEDLRQGAMRLIDRLGMGSQYQVMGVTTTPPEVEVYPFPLPSADQNDSSPGKAAGDVASSAASSGPSE
ncbi:S-adenosyl-L-methionine-dependent methyltransferase [Papiliotrema laurentii]|uniref:Protein arginine methyltransferase NDUFAF7 n=1 Tax=Papiliotrema laurentii TaxID=5418 RepID=A0AAD9FX48_PAPLA|nr:S-adenosyl-L-methionine-dependent methyltransferase [Papiliotrema laurentii]